MRITRHTKTLITLTLAASLGSITSSLAGETTQVYKSINADGSISYSDTQQAQSEILNIKPISTVPAFVTKNKQSIRAQKQAILVDSYYQRLEVLHPKSDTALQSGNGDIKLKIDIEPPLRPTDQLQIKLDGAVISKQQESELQIQTLDRGTHSIEVKVLSAENQTLQSTSSTFTLHRPTVR